ncbi:hypothetical protein [Streptomyces sp. NPDC002205]|uniref:hypothetical protein n=2 Tax=unclassified Streptomyces TaxID=2593676 RepID=UPI003330926F
MPPRAAACRGLWTRRGRDLGIPSQDNEQRSTGGLQVDGGFDTAFVSFGHWTRIAGTGLDAPLIYDAPNDIWSTATLAPDGSFDTMHAAAARRFGAWESHRASNRLRRLWIYARYLLIESFGGRMSQEPEFVSCVKGGMSCLIFLMIAIVIGSFVIQAVGLGTVVFFIVGSAAILGVAWYQRSATKKRE